MDGPPPVPPPPPPHPELAASEAKPAIQQLASQDLSQMEMQELFSVTSDSPAFWTSQRDQARLARDFTEQSFRQLRFVRQMQSCLVDDPSIGASVAMSGPGGNDDGSDGAGEELRFSYDGFASDPARFSEFLNVNTCVDGERPEDLFDSGGASLSFGALPDVLVRLLALRRQLDETVRDCMNTWESGLNQIKQVHNKQQVYEKMENDYYRGMKKYLKMTATADEATLQQMDSELHTKRQFLELTRFDIDTELRFLFMARELGTLGPLSKFFSAYERFSGQASSLLDAHKPEISELRQYTHNVHDSSVAWRDHRRAMRRQLEKMLFTDKSERTPLTVGPATGSGIRDLDRDGQDDSSSTVDDPSRTLSGVLFLPATNELTGDFRPIWCCISDGTLVIDNMPERLTADLCMIDPAVLERKRTPSHGSLQALKNLVGSTAGDGAGEGGPSPRGGAHDPRRHKNSYATKKEPFNPVMFPLMICTIKEERSHEKRFVFSLISPQRSLQLQADSYESMRRWIDCIQGEIGAALNSGNPRGRDEPANDEATLTALTSVPGNAHCADCGTADPEWMSINLGIMMCLDCSGFHRSLGTHISKVRSSRLDKIDEFQLELMQAVGNRESNLIWEHDVQGATKPTPASKNAERQEWIMRKYQSKDFLSRSDSSWTQLELNQALFHATMERSYLLMIQLIAEGADINWPNDDFESRTALIQAAMEGSSAAVQLLIRNGGLINATEVRGWTCMHYSVYYNDVRTVKQVLAHGGRSLITKEDYEGWTPLSMAEQAFHDEVSAPQGGDSALVDMLYEAKRALDARAEKERLRVLQHGRSRGLSTDVSVPRKGGGRGGGGAGGSDGFGKMWKSFKKGFAKKLNLRRESNAQQE